MDPLHAIALAPDATALVVAPSFAQGFCSTASAKCKKLTVGRFHH
jgi:hypothetical protein